MRALKAIDTGEQVAEQAPQIIADSAERIGGRSLRDPTVAGGVLDEIADTLQSRLHLRLETVVVEAGSARVGLVRADEVSFVDAAIDAELLDDRLAVRLAVRVVRTGLSDRASGRRRRDGRGRDIAGRHRNARVDESRDARLHRRSRREASQIGRREDRAAEQALLAAAAGTAVLAAGRSRRGKKRANAPTTTESRI